MAGFKGFKFGRKKELELESLSSIREKNRNKTEEELIKELDDIANEVLNNIQIRHREMELYRPKTYEEIRAEQEAAGTRSSRDRALDILWDLRQKEKTEGVIEGEITLAKNLAAAIKITD